MGQGSSTQRRTSDEQEDDRSVGLIDRPSRLSLAVPSRSRSGILDTRRHSGIDLLSTRASSRADRRHSWFPSASRGGESDGLPHVELNSDLPSTIRDEIGIEERRQDEEAGMVQPRPRNSRRLSAWMSERRHTIFGGTQDILHEEEPEGPSDNTPLPARMGNSTRASSRLLRPWTHRFGRGPMEDNGGRSRRIGSISNPLPISSPSEDVLVPDNHLPGVEDLESFGAPSPPVEAQPRPRPQAVSRLSSRVRHSLHLPSFGRSHANRSSGTEDPDQELDTPSEHRSSTLFRRHSTRRRHSSMGSPGPTWEHRRNGTDDEENTDGRHQHHHHHHHHHRHRHSHRRRASQQPPQDDDQAATLSRLLSVAAAATAASLVGDTGRSFADSQDVGSTSGDGSFDGFLQTLRNGSLATALRNGGRQAESENNDLRNGESNPSPVNIFRMFRFGNVSNENRGSGRVGQETGDTRSNGTSTEQSTANEGERSQASQGRMVPVIIVGIRSVAQRTPGDQEDGSTPSPFFDAFTNMPLSFPPNSPRGASSTLMRRTDRRSRFSRTRRTSLGRANIRSSVDERPRLAPISSSLPATGTSTPRSPTNLSTVFSDTPPGPQPPPSTPAEHALSVGSSGASTPYHRPSSASASGLPQFSNADTVDEEAVSTHPPNTAESTPNDNDSTPSTPTARRRRRSDSEFARFRDLGSGASRRNGIVGDSEVDTPPPGVNAVDEPRSWIIYVFGGSYPEDHPFLTTPSLFTDSPTYEDMVLLSSLVGPAKPPVASREDLDAAAGLCEIASTEQPGVFVAMDVTSQERHEMPLGARCLVCLSSYEDGEAARRLGKCGHLFHRECIDEWLTTGRNSCPLCRGQGVDEKSRPLSTLNNSTPPAPASASSPPGTSDSSTS